MAPSLKLTSGLIIAIFLLYSSKRDFCVIGSYFSQIAPTCVHSLFKIISIRYSIVFHVLYI